MWLTGFHSLHDIKIEFFEKKLGVEINQYMSQLYMSYNHDIARIRQKQTVIGSRVLPIDRYVDHSFFSECIFSAI